MYLWMKTVPTQLEKKKLKTSSENLIFMYRSEIREQWKYCTDCEVHLNIHKTQSGVFLLTSALNS